MKRIYTIWPGSIYSNNTTEVKIWKSINVKSNINNEKSDTLWISWWHKMRFYKIQALSEYKHFTNWK